MPHRPNHRGRQYRRNYAHGGPHARANEFRNRRTGQAVPAGAPYHMHPDKGPMEGAVHNPDIPGGTAGHDFYDRVNGNSTSNNRMNGRTSSGGGYQRGGRVNRRKFVSGGHTHGHDHYIEELGLRTSHQSVMGWTNHPMNPNPGQEHFGFNDDVIGDAPFGGHTATTGGHSHPGRTMQQMTYRGNGGGNNINRRNRNVSNYRGGGRTSRRMEHGGSHCGPGLMYQNGGCVSYEHGGHHQVINSDSDRQRRKR